MRTGYPNCDLGELRLVAGTNGREGRVEICLNGTWGTIADDGWSTGDAKTACRQLGFAAYGKEHTVCIAYNCLLPIATPQVPCPAVMLALDKELDQYG